MNNSFKCLLKTIRVFVINAFKFAQIRLRTYSENRPQHNCDILSFLANFDAVHSLITYYK